MRRVLGSTLLLAFLGCAEVPRVPDDLLGAATEPPPRLLFVGAHPDDEGLAGPFLSWACGEGRARCHFVVLSAGEGSGCLHPDGCGDLVRARRAEMRRVAKGYKASLSHYRFSNSPFVFWAPPPLEEALARWRSEGDPGGLVAREIRRFRPDLVVSLDPDHGFTGHPEHRLAGVLAFEGVYRAADEEEAFAAPAWRVPRMFLVENKAFPMTVTGADPRPATWSFDVSRRCGELRCLERAGRIIRLHDSQRPYMGLLLLGQGLSGQIYLHEVQR